MSFFNVDTFLASLSPMKGHSDTRVIRANYKKVLMAGFRCDRKLHRYVHPSGAKIYVSDVDENGYMYWKKC